MATPFAALETRLSSALIAKLSNVTALVDGVEVAGVFDSAVDTAFSMVAGQRLSLTVEASVAATRGSAVVIGPDSYRVAEEPLPDAGIMRLVLEAV